MKETETRTVTVIVAAALLVVGLSVFVVATAIPVKAEGVAHEKNFGQCKQDHNDQACRSVIKPGNG
jgi:uncharacterized membrane protein